MNILTLVNLIIINILILLGLSYFWSFYTYKLFKPWMWLENRKQKDFPKELTKLERKMKDKNLFYSIWFILKNIDQHNIEGKLAEVGVYKGETALILHHALPNRELLLFDDFSGTPKQVEREDCEGNMQTDIINSDGLTEEKMQALVNNHPKVIIKAGEYKTTFATLEQEEFAFVSIDGNFYENTKTALEFFYPRLAQGGSLLIHDYNHKWEGVQNAVHEFLQAIPENFTPLPDMYGSIVITKNKL